MRLSNTTAGEWWSALWVEYVDLRANTTLDFLNGKTKNKELILLVAKDHLFHRKKGDTEHTTSYFQKATCSRKQSVYRLPWWITEVKKELK
jgi:hypothetical protein